MVKRDKEMKKLSYNFILYCTILISGTLHAQRYHAIVNPGESIQAAIEAAPEKPKEPYIILIKNGIYNEKVIIDRPNIVLVGENRDSTRLIRAELASKILIREYKGRPAGNGVIILQEGADDCIISCMTVYNNYGSTVEATTAHQISIFGHAMIWHDGRGNYDKKLVITNSHFDSKSSPVK
jgi:pectin methylesterase-like acyl-CoA thioesterase